MTTEEYLVIYKKYPGSDNTYEGWKEDLESIRDFNKNLISKYSWLIPRNRWTGEISEDYDYEFTELDEMPEGWRIAFGDQMVEEIHQQLVRFDFVDSYKIVQIKEKWGGLRWYDNGTPIGRLSEDYETFTRRGTETLKADWDTKKYCMREDYSEHYISFFDREKVGMTKEKIEEYNKDAIHHYRLYKILEECTIPEIIRKYEKLSYKTCIACGQPALYYTKGYICPYCEDCKQKMISSGKYYTEASFTGEN